MPRIPKPAAAALLALAACGGSDRSAPDLTVPSGQSCTQVRAIPDEGDNSHVGPGATVRYSTNPPAIGRHAARPAPAGVYDRPIPNEIQVHNLEHGHVVVQYRALEPAQVKEIREAVDGKAMMVMAPKPDMAPVLALTAWGRIRVCAEFPADVAGLIGGFARAHGDNAPESVP